MKTKHKPRRSRQAQIIRWILFAIPVLVVAILIGQSFDSARQSENSARRRGLPFFESAEAAQPYPRTLPASQFGKGSIAHAYQAAENIPEILVQQPCYCICMREGHKSLLDCFTTNHAAGCTICQQEALFVERLNREGKSAKEIREAIIRGEWRNQPLG